MKVIRSFDELKYLDTSLIKFILDVCPWLTYDWNPHETGIVYILQDSDQYHNWILTQPHLDADGNHCRDRISLKMATRDLWKPPAYFNETLGYWHVVAVFDEDYEGTFFLSAGYVQSIPALEKIFQEIRLR
ncbi:hypothetical protein [Desulfocastanea catecholica]